MSNCEAVFQRRQILNPVIKLTLTEIEQKTLNIKTEIAEISALFMRLWSARGHCPIGFA